MDVRTTDEYDAWFAELPDKQSKQVTVYVTRLRALGHMVRMPVSRPVGDGIFELRPTADGVEIRVFYSYYKGAVLLVGGIKSGTNDARFLNEYKPKAIQALNAYKERDAQKLHPSDSRD